MRIRNSQGLNPLLAFTAGEASGSALAGRWVGSRQIGQEPPQADRLILLEDPRGVLFGDWDTMIITGHRLADQRMEFRGRGAAGAFVGRGRVVDGALRLSFTVTSQSGQRIEGTSLLYRPG